MRRTWLLWLAFTLCLAVVLAAMGWVSLATLRLDEAEARARQQAALEENVRLALWRMDSALAPLLAQESARPYFAYSTFLPVDRAYGRMFNRGGGGEALVPSPLLTEASPHVLVHFQFEPDGRLASPRVPAGNNHRLAVPRYLPEESMRRAEKALGRVRDLTDRDRLMAVLPKSAAAPVEVVTAPMNVNPDGGMAQARRNDYQGLPRGQIEYSQRREAVSQNAAALVQSQIANTIPGPSSYSNSNPAWTSTDLSGVLMTPLWIDGDLVLARRVAVGGQEYVQGCLLDWPGIKQWLLETASDLLPEADLEPLANGPPEAEARMLAALPVRLVPGALPLEEAAGVSPIRLTLLVAWGCVLLAAAAVAALVWGVIRLSERRAAFVNAVTHELRTPLTTFHMYTEMLTEGMVSDVRQQQDYLNTLRAEASRLSHLVENVLAYARLERGRRNGRVEPVAVESLLESIRCRLEDRARQAGMELVVEADDGARETLVRANPSAVEQILFNLVDNACKYASGAADKRIHLVAQRSGDAVRIIVRDHGPGIARPASGRLFRPFSKSAQEAANSAPGVGLGLALSTRLARDMGARLHVDSQNNEGAAFVLSLPCAG